MKCTAEMALTVDEALRLNALPGANNTVGTEPLGCDFDEHDPAIPHAYNAQLQEVPGDAPDILWWLRWDDSGHRELLVAPGCRKVAVDETCLLIKGHPGSCDQETGLEEMRQLYRAGVTEIHEGFAKLLEESSLGAPHVKAVTGAHGVHPLPVGAEVYHRSQMWAHHIPGGTAVIEAVEGPLRDGAYEYTVLACRDFSRRPGPDNPMDRETQWASYATRPAFKEE